MKESKVKWHGQDNYNMNCDIEELEKLGFENSSWHNDLAPSYTNKKGNVQVFFFDLNNDEMKIEQKKFKYSLMKLDEHGEYLDGISQTNSFDEMIELVKKNENDWNNNNCRDYNDLFVFNKPIKEQENDAIR